MGIFILLSIVEAAAEALASDALRFGGNLQCRTVSMLS
jgi:hypothetical protein